jgi:hypothetical protein
LEKQADLYSIGAFVVGVLSLGLFGEFIYEFFMRETARGIKDLVFSVAFFS